MSTTHELKSWPQHFAPLMNGEKSFELRKNDRDFQVGDMLRLREYDPVSKTYTGREEWREITYLIKGYGYGASQPMHGLQRGYVVLGLTQISAAGCSVG